MNRMMAIIEREMRKFFRSPALMMVSMVMPLVQLIVLGNAFGGKIRDAKMGVVDEDHGTQAIRIKEAFDAVRANADVCHDPLRQRSAGARRRAQRQDSGRGDYSAAVFEAGVRKESSADCADSRQQRQLHEFYVEDEMTRRDRRVEPARRVAARCCSRRRSKSWSSIPISST
jgi:ABC-type Na+ efflux pump permease subunit